MRWEYSDNLETTATAADVGLVMTIGAQTGDLSRGRRPDPTK